MQKRRLVFATHNSHKLEEVRAILGENFDVVGLSDLGFDGEIPETGTTLQENALQKAQYVSEHFGLNCFADDTGLEVEALDGAPGVYSARYAGEDANFANNRAKLLREMSGKTNRKAQFRTIVVLMMNGETHYFEGKVEGEILTEERGAGGFGYDALFMPAGFDKTFGELSSDEKNAISHRGRAMQKLVEFLKQQYA